MDKDFLAAQEEWNAVASVTIATSGHSAPEYKQGDEVKNATSPLISTAECIHHFRSHVHLPLHKRNIKPSIQYSGLRSCLHLLFGPPSLQPGLKNCRDLIFAMAAWPLENEDRVHIQMLNTVYKQLMQSKIDPPRYGQHWDDIGFQGTDPATDLRGGGCLGLVNMLYLTTDMRYVKLARAIHTLSNHITQNFPFSVMSLNVTRIALRALREQRLNKLANKSGDLVTVFNDFYVACFLHLFTIWRDGHKTIEDSGHVIKDTESYCLNKVSVVMKNLHLYLEKRSSADSESAAVFTNLDNVDT